MTPHFNDLNTSLQWPQCIAQHQWNECMQTTLSVSNPGKSSFFYLHNVTANFFLGSIIPCFNNPNALLSTNRMSVRRWLQASQTLVNVFYYFFVTLKLISFRWWLLHLNDPRHSTCLTTLPLSMHLSPCYCYHTCSLQSCSHSLPENASPHIIQLHCNEGTM